MTAPTITDHGQGAPAAHSGYAVVGSDSPPATSRPTPNLAAQVGDQAADHGQVGIDTHTRSAVVGSDTPPASALAPPSSGSRVGNQATDHGHPPPATQSECAVVGSDTPPATEVMTPSRPPRVGGQTADHGQKTGDAHARAAVVGSPGPDQTTSLSTTPSAAPLADPVLGIAADVLDDLEKVHTANANRLRILTTTEPDSDGIHRGHGLDPSHPDVARLAALVKALDAAEHTATLNLQRIMRAHPLSAWAKAQRGVGPKQIARLLAAIGDPAVNQTTGEFRTVSQLWAYCGLHTLPADPGSRDPQVRRAGGEPDPAGSDHRVDETHTASVAARRAKGQKANWSTTAKTRAWLVIESCMKQIDPPCKGPDGIGDHQPGCDCSPYRVIVDNRRRHTARTHPDWTPLHSLRDGMRIASKALLRDLWREARRLHDEQAATG